MKTAQVFLLGWLAAVQAGAAGVTVVTHGLQLDTTRPAWLEEMGSAIARRAGPSTALIQIEVGRRADGSLGILSTNLAAGLPPSPDSTNAEAVVELFWQTVAGLTDSVDTTAVAEQVVPFLISPIAWSGSRTSPPLAQLPLHLIGHSRGGSVMAELARLLGQRAIWVDHLTTLDPHPLSEADCIGIFCPPVYDAPAEIFENVIFADNYRERDDSGTLIDISGYPLPGSAEVDLTPRFDADGLADNSNADHSETHDWYYGTIDPQAQSLAGAPIPRAAWRHLGDVGFGFSSIAGGRRLRFQQQTNYSGIGLRWLGAARSPAPSGVGPGWPNVALENLSGIWNVFSGQTLSFSLWAQASGLSNALATATVELFADTDQNPWNNSGVVRWAALAIGSSNASVIATNVLWTAGPDAGPTFILARITQPNGLSRICYLDRAIEISAPPRVQFQSIARASDGAVRLALQSPPGASITVQTSPDLARWADLTNFVSGGAVEIIDSTASSAPRRFYRAIGGR